MLLLLLLVLVALADASSNIVHLADNRLVSVSDTSYRLLSSPPAGSRVVVSHGGGGIVLAFHPQPRDHTSEKKRDASCPEELQVSKYGNNSDTWETIVSSSLIPFNSTVWDQTADSVYLFGGVDCSGHYSSQLYAFNVTASEFYMPQNTNPPTELVHGSAVRLENSAAEALLVGGKAPDGWIGMNQVAVFASDTWSFKSVANSSNVDARANPRLLHLSDDRLLIFGGSVAGRDPKPYLVELDMASWSWKEVPLQLQDTPLGATVIGDKLIVVSADSDRNRKRSWFLRRRSQGGGSDLSFHSFDTKSWKSLDLDISQSSGDGDNNQNQNQDSDNNNNNNGNDNNNNNNNNDNDNSNNDNNDDRNNDSNDSKSKTVTDDHTSATTPHTTTTGSTTTSSASRTASASSSATSLSSSSSMSTGEIAALSTVLPVSVISAVAAAVFFLRRSRKQKGAEKRTLTLSPMSFDHADGTAAETASIDSWNAKRELYEKHSSNPNRLSFPASISSAATVTRRKVSQQQPLDDDCKTIYNNDNDNNNNDDDDLFTNRDVQVLVSSVRRSKLVVTNPDTNTNSDDENDSN
ncbi:hypothetical protein TRICI_005861 [Trichomonascus ciferrii]|uniref:Galactose oxidase n=1 Tax=Trichomonascus ciferrii TaxID=44093 RepID=A0A642UTB9_9ASCO|nr:hypothetical protein TRICI_005861 [Trichomonascus ciferrii]